MTPLEIILLANIVGVGALALWQNRRLNTLESRCADKTHIRLACETFKLRAEKLEARQVAVEAGLAAIPQALTVRFKEYARSDRVAKLENSLDQRIADAIVASQVTPIEKAHKLCSRCNRVVARYEYFPDSDTVICANCNYKPHEK